jgi:hypothetical protein
MLRIFFALISLALVSLLVIQPSPACASTVPVAPGSFVTMEVTDNTPLVPQAPGSLTTSLSGTLQFQIANNAIWFPGGSNITLGVHPGPFFPDVPNVNLAGQASDEQLGITIYGLYADVSVDIYCDPLSDPIPLNPDGTFDASGLWIELLSGTFQFVLPPAGDARQLGGSVVLSEGPLTGRVTPFGHGSYELVLPFQTSDGQLTFDHTLAGEILALVPEPSTWLLTLLGASAAGTMRLARMRSRATQPG